MENESISFSSQAEFEEKAPIAFGLANWLTMLEGSGLKEGTCLFEKEGNSQCLAIVKGRKLFLHEKVYASLVSEYHQLTGKRDALLTKFWDYLIAGTVETVENAF